MLDNLLNLIDALGKVEAISDSFVQSDTEFAELEKYSEGYCGRADHREASVKDLPGLLVRLC